MLDIFDDFSKFHNISSTFHFEKWQKFGKNEEKPCPEIFTGQKLKFSAKLVKANICKCNFDDFLGRIFFSFFAKYCRKFFIFFRKMKMRKNGTQPILALFSLFLANSSVEYLGKNTLKF